MTNSSRIEKMMKNRLETLLIINRYKILTIHQMCDLSGESRQRFSHNLNWAKKQKYVENIDFTVKGSPRFSGYYLTSKGIVFLSKNVGLFDTELFSSNVLSLSKDKSFDKMHLLHHRMIVDFEIQLQKEAEQIPKFLPDCTNAIPSYYCKEGTRQSLTHLKIEKSVAYPTGISLIPDAYATVSTSRAKYDYFFEADRGTESIGFASKISRGNTLINKFLRYVKIDKEQKTWQQKVGSDNNVFRVLTITSSESRIQSTLVKLKRALQQAGCLEYKEIFWFLSIDAFKEYGIFSQDWHAIGQSHLIWGQRKSQRPSIRDVF